MSRGDTHQELGHLIFVVDGWPRECQLLEIRSMLKEIVKLSCLIRTFICQPCCIAVFEAKIFDRLSVFLQMTHIDLSVIRVIHFANKRETLRCSQ